MINILRKNYALTLWLTRVIYGLALLLGQMFAIDSAFGWLSMALGVAVPRAWYVYLAYAVVMTAVMELIIRLLTRLIFNFLRLVIIPFNEFIILFMLSGAVVNAVSGLIKLVYLVSPAAMVFGESLITPVVSAAVYFGLFLLVKRLYLNDKNAPYVFRCGVITFMIFSVISLFIL